MVVTVDQTRGQLSKLDQALFDAKDEEETKLLLKAGADVNATNDCGDTVLMLAKTEGQTAALIAAGADVNATNNYGNTALMLAKTESQKKLLQDAEVKTVSDKQSSDVDRIQIIRVPHGTKVQIEMY